MPVFTLLFTLKNFLFLWLIEDTLIIKRRQTLLLSSALLLIFVLNFFIPVIITSLFNVLYVCLKSFFLFEVYKNWLIPALSFYLMTFILFTVWLISFALPDVLFQLPNEFLIILPFIQSLLLLAICLCIRFLLKKYNFAIVLKSIKKKYLSLSLVIFSSAFVRFAIYQSISVKLSPQTLIFISLLTCLSGFLTALFFYLIALTYNQRQSYLSLSKSMDSVKKKYESTDEFRHDYKNILISIKGYLEKNEVKNAQDYIDSIIDYSSPVLLPDYYLQLLNLSIPPLQAVLLAFMEKVTQKNIHVSIDIPEKIYQIDMELVDLIRCFTILLDNAFEAQFEEDPYYIKISITQTKEQTALLVKNSFNPNNQISLNQMFQDKFSSKQDHKGKGLTIIHKITSEYTGITTNFYIENMFFHAELNIKNAI